MRNLLGNITQPLKLISQGAEPRATSNVALPRANGASRAAVNRSAITSPIILSENSPGAPKIGSTNPLWVRPTPTTDKLPSLNSLDRGKSSEVINQYRSSVAAQAVERWGAAIDKLGRFPLFKRELTSEASLGAMRHTTEFKASVMVTQVGSAYGPSKGGIPLDSLMRLIGQEIANRTLGIPKTICIIGHSMAETAKPDLNPEQRERTNRAAFAVLRLVEKLNALGLNIEPRLDTDVLHTKDFRQAQRDLSAISSKTYPLAHLEACLVEAMRRENGAQVYGGWSSFGRLRDFEAVLEGAPSAKRDFVRYCSVPVRQQLETALPLEYAMIAMEPGVALTAHGLLRTNPDVVVPILPGPKSNPSSDQQRLMLNRNDDSSVTACFKNIFELPQTLQKAQIEFQRHNWHLVMNLHRVLPEVLQHPQELLADLDIAERLVQLWKSEAVHTKRQQSATVNAHLWQSMLAAASVRSEVLKHYLGIILDEFGLELEPSSTPGKILIPATQQTPAGALLLSDESFKGAPQRRGTASLNTSFQQAQS